ncbi:NlpC/P60 family protein [Hymenobacter sp. GOD-10R]|uniref:NlpC/P60 family protein n=1 Tax=Hymenobacter sp. GOD-10R TaxID=3093922 RepID=UPI002D770E27|nr:NlpC/P60 family protein [Hymenobacter sp. GOD-10R]WRQ31823.1 NlpC/P60 family protein [Hymenobacter sp. GOD-10R]
MTFFINSRWVPMLLFGALLVLQACASKDPNPSTPDDPERPSEKLVELLDAQAEKTYKLSELELPDGSKLLDTLRAYDPNFLNDYPSLQRGGVATASEPTNYESQKRLLLARMQVVANNITTRKLHQQAQGVQSNEPAQPNGLAYVYGAKSYASRTPGRPTTIQTQADVTKRGYKGTWGTEALYGLDCSGFILRVAAGANLKLDAEGASGQSDPAVWNKALQSSSYHVEARKVDVSISDLESGDIIFWPDQAPHHIGIVLRDAKGLGIFQSNGSDCSYRLHSDPEEPCLKNGVIDEACVLEQMKANRGPGRGPRPLTLTTTWFGSSYGVIRFFPEYKLTKLSGDGQTGQLYAQLPQPVQLKVVDEDGVAQKGVTVTFVPKDATSGSATPSSAVSDANGLVKTTWTLGSTLGTQQLNAAVKSSASATAAFTATANNNCIDVANPILQLLTGGSSRTWVAEGFDDLSSNNLHCPKATFNGAGTPKLVFSSTGTCANTDASGSYPISVSSTCTYYIAQIGTTTGPFCVTKTSPTTTLISIPLASGSGSVSYTLEAITATQLRIRGNSMVMYYKAQ